MWVAESCFDGEEVPFRKCLLPGNEYHFGRKAPADLVLADKTVSRESVVVSIGQVNTQREDVRPPVLRIQVLKRPIRLIPGENEAEFLQDRVNFIGINLDPECNKELQTGDTIALTKSAPAVKFLWLPIVFNAVLKVPKEQIEERKQAIFKLGIRLERSKQMIQDATHLVLPSNSALTIPLMQALASAVPLVTMQYLDEILRRAEYDRDDDRSLQKHCVLPSVDNYFPEEVKVEDMTHKEVKVALAPNQKRKNLFIGTSILFVHDETGLGKTLEAMYTICKSSGARMSTANISQYQDDESLLRLLRRLKSEAETLLAECGEAASEAPDDGLVVICNAEAPQSTWYKRVVRMTRQLSIAMPSHGEVAVSKSILYADARRFLNTLYEDSFENDMTQDSMATTLPPTLPEERKVERIDEIASTAVIPIPSASVESDRPSRSTPSSPPTSHLPSTNQVSPRKPKRRADMARRDPLEDIFGMSASSTAPILVTGSEATIPATAQQEDAEQTQRSIARPRRHDGLDSKRPRMSEAYRSLFGTDLGDDDAQMTEEFVSATPGESFPLTRRYREELDEADRLESQQESQAPMENVVEIDHVENTGDKGEIGRKRRAKDSQEDFDQTRKQKQRREEEGNTAEEGKVVEEIMEVVEKDVEPTIRCRAEQRAVSQEIHSKEEVAAVLVKEMPANLSKSNGADTDSKFLQAMATSKKSKKPLDQFDKEFNLLRIAKPTHRTGHYGKIIADVEDPEYRAWEQMTASDFDINAAGNFIQVDFVPLIYQRSEEEERKRAEREKQRRIEWNGKPNFKKFKTKQRKKRAPIVMDIQEGMDYGLGDAYIRRSGRQGVDSDNLNEDEEVVELMAPIKNDLVTRRRGSRDMDMFSEDEDQRGSVVPSSTRATQRGTFRTQKERVESEGEREQEGTRNRKGHDLRLEVDAEMDDSIFHSKRQDMSRQQSSLHSGSKRSTQVFSSDEDEASSTFSGFRKKRKT